MEREHANRTRPHIDKEPNQSQRTTQIYKVCVPPFRNLTRMRETATTTKRKKKWNKNVMPYILIMSSSQQSNSNEFKITQNVIAPTIDNVAYLPPLSTSLWDVPPSMCVLTWFWVNKCWKMAFLWLVDCHVKDDDFGPFDKYHSEIVSEACDSMSLFVRLTDVS